MLPLKQNNLHRSRGLQGFSSPEFMNSKNSWIISKIQILVTGHEWGDNSQAETATFILELV